MFLYLFPDKLYTYGGSDFQNFVIIALLETLSTIKRYSNNTPGRKFKYNYELLTCITLLFNIYHKVAFFIIVSEQYTSHPQNVLSWINAPFRKRPQAASDRCYEGGAL